MRHLYFHSSNLDYVSELLKDELFEPFSKYCDEQSSLASENEYGRIKTHNNYYHFIMGHPRHENCPWCGSGVELKIIPELKINDHTPFCIQCVKCSSRGPILNVNLHTLLCDKSKKYCDDWMWHRYKHRRTWDEDLVNPYEKMSEFGEECL